MVTKCSICKVSADDLTCRLYSNGYCKDCNGEYARWNHIRIKYGLTKNEVEQALINQAGMCDICGTAIDMKSLRIDHCHASLLVRGLLCNNCNVGLGNFQDSPRLLEAAAEYLRRL